MALSGGVEPPTTRCRKPALCPLSYESMNWRGRGELNTHGRVCSALPSRSATSSCWRGQTDLNRRAPGQSRLLYHLSYAPLFVWSEQEDLNLRSRGSRPRGFPGFPMLRYWRAREDSNLHAPITVPMVRSHGRLRAHLELARPAGAYPALPV